MNVRVHRTEDNGERVRVVGTVFYNGETVRFGKNFPRSPKYMCTVDEKYPEGHELRPDGFDGDTPMFIVYFYREGVSRIEKRQEAGMFSIEKESF